MLHWVRIYNIKTVSNVSLIARCVYFQLFSVDEKLCTTHWDSKYTDGGSTTSARLADITHRRVTIAKILVNAGLDPNVQSFNLPSEYTLPSLAEKNMNSGGPEVLDISTGGVAEPRSLKSTCRLAVRRCLSAPVLVEGNVRKLPISKPVMRYVAFDMVKQLDTAA